MTVTQDLLIEQALAAILKREAGFVNNPADRGGATKFGVTRPALAAFRGKPASEISDAEIAALTVDEARAVLRRDFIERPGFLAIADSYLFWLVADSSVNHGPARAARWLQAALGVVQDGVLGPKSAEALRRANAGMLSRRFLAARIRFYGLIISKNLTDADRDGIPDNAEMAAGWTDRVADFVERLP